MSLRFRVLGSGSTGNATLVEAGETRILLDAGLGPRVLAERVEAAGVDPGSIAAVVLSHEHNDHARGAVAFCRRFGVRIVASRGTYAAAGLGAEELPGFDVLEPERPLAVGGLRVLGCAVPHDAAGPLAFVVSSNGSRFGHATDLGHVNPALTAAFRDCDAILIESNYDPTLLGGGPYPWSLKERILGPRGHLSNDDVARYLRSGLSERCRTLVLAHVSQKNNHPELVTRCAEDALARRGRTEVALSVCASDGLEWVEVAGAPEPPRSGQMTLF